MAVVLQDLGHRVWGELQAVPVAADPAAADQVKEEQQVQLTQVAVVAVVADVRVLAPPAQLGEWVVQAS